MVQKIVGIAVALLVLAIVFPIALTELGDADIPAEIDQLEPLLLVLVPLLAVIAVVMYLFPKDVF